MSVILLIGQVAFSCDQCSIQVGNGVIMDGHYIGYGFRFRKQLETFELGKSLDGPKHLDHFTERGEVKELFTVHEMVVNYHIAGNWHVTAAIPMVNTYRSIDGVTKYDIYGLGDPWLLLRNQQSWERNNGKLWLALGVGAKMPLGRTDYREEGELVDLDMQPGSGSWDALFSLSVVREYQRLFVLAQATGSYMGESPDEYRYGNSLTTGTSIGYHLTKDTSYETSVLLGTSVEVQGRDKTNNERTGEGSTTVYADAGLQVQLNKRLIGSVSAQRAIITEIDDRQLPTIYKLRTSLRYTF